MITRFFNMKGSAENSSVACSATTIIINKSHFLFDVLRTSYIDWISSPPPALPHSRTPQVNFIPCNKHVFLIDGHYGPVSRFYFFIIIITFQL